MRLPLLLWLSALLLNGQFSPTGTTTLSVTIGADASLMVNTTSTALGGTMSFGGLTGTTNLTYKIRTSETSGSGIISLKTTTDFSPAGGPSVGSPPNPGDTLSYTCTVSGPGTGCASSQIVSLSTSTPVATFGPGANSANSGNSAAVNWTLAGDPAYKTGAYSAIITFTVTSL